MTSFADINTQAQDSVFRGQCLYALQVAAVNVMAESGATPGHAQRVAYATIVLNGAINSYQVALAVLTNPTIANEVAAGIPDSDIQYAINSLFSALAGVSAQ